jgi:hypothetical protein
VVRAGKELVQHEGEEGSDGALSAAVVFRLAGYRQKVLQSGPCRGFVDPSISGKTVLGVTRESETEPKLVRATPCTLKIAPERLDPDRERRLTQAVVADVPLAAARWMHTRSAERVGAAEFLL